MNTCNRKRKPFTAFSCLDANASGVLVAEV